MDMTILYIVLGVAALLAAVTIAVCLRLALIIVRPKITPYDECFRLQVESGETDEALFSGYNAEEFFLKSDFDCDIHCMVINRRPDAAFSDGRERVAVFAHGFTYSLWGGLKYADVFRELGFSCVLFDQRGHGKSGRAPVTMGYYEKRDLALVCKWARERFGGDCVLGVHGESMGAATVLMYAPTDDGLAFVVEDCAYSSLPEQLYHNVRTMFRLPKFPTMCVSSLMSRLLGGVFFSRVQPAREVAKCRGSLPILFIHGEADDFVPARMVYANYDAKRGVKAIATFPGAGHAQSFASDAVRYRRVLTEFLEDNGVIPRQ